MIKQRNIALCILWSILTCGIYSIYWFICLTDEVNTIANKPDGTSGGMAFLFSLISCGIYSFYWMYKQGEKLDEAKQARGMKTDSLAVLYLILGLLGVGFVSYCLMQNELNKMA